MKKSLLSLRGLLTAAIAIITFGANATVWDFTTLGATDKNNLDADKTNWTYDSDNGRWGNSLVLSKQILTANGQELDFTKGLQVSAAKANQVRIDPKKGCFTINNSAATITIPSLKAGDNITVLAECSSPTVARYVLASNVTASAGFSEESAAKSKTKVTHKGTVSADGDVTLSTNGGMYFYKIEVTGEGEGPVGPTPSVPNHAVAMNPMANQMMLTIADNSVKYYNTAELESVDFDKTAGKVTVTPKAADWTDEYLRNVSTISFTKGIPTGSEGEIVNRGVNITEAKGWLESAYVKWTPFEGATSYNVYVKGGKYADYTRIDRELVRDYGSYGRADMVGLPANVYALKVVPVIDGTEDTASASEATGMSVKAHDRSGFAFLRNTGTAPYDGSGIGAYKENGELKDNATVIYVTAETAKTVTCKVFYDKAYKEFTGLQTIMDALQKGTAKEPICVRIVGTIKKDDLDKISSSAEGLQIKGKNTYAPVNVTIEGIGDDATTWGFGFLIRNCSSVEMRNFANMCCMDDALSFDTENAHCWVHHMDFFYGSTGGASDQAKGDGTVDIKGNTRYITVAYNHFWDNGKTSLCGMKSESTEDYADYHHNWFDHSDSRHPRVRTITTHVWNNYYDGVAKYGVGATMGSSIFVESNFYRHTKDPMMISRQGTDGKGDGTFSGEDGGMIKSFGNLYAEKGASSNYTVITHTASADDFDCYEASSRDEQVPASYVTKFGSTSYSNFDTNPSLMHTYTAQSAAEVPATVMGFYGAGRLNKGDFQWTFDNATEDTNYDVISALKTALVNYSSKLVKIF